MPGGGSPDMGNVSADGKVLWLSGRYNNVVYAIEHRDRPAARQDPGRLGPTRAVRVAASRAATPSGTPASCAEPRGCAQTGRAGRERSGIRASTTVPG